MSIKTKILLSYIILVAIPTALLITYINKNSYEMFSARILELEEYALDKLNLELTHLFDINDNSDNNIPINTALYLELDNLLREKTIPNGNAFYLINNENIIATSDNQIQLPKEFTLSDIVESAESGTELITKDGTTHLLSTTVPETPFILVYLVSISKFKDSLIEIWRSSLLIAIIVSCLSCIIALLIANSISKRIQILSLAMNATKNGDLDVYVNKNGQDEITLLENGFNEMISSIKKQKNEDIL